MLRHLVLLVVLCPLLAMADGHRRSRGRSSGSTWMSLLGPNTTLTLGLSGGESFVQNQQVVPPADRLLGGNLWVGAALHPLRSNASPFIAGGLELGLVGPTGTEFRRLGFEVIPEVRLGIAGLSEVEGFTFPGIQLYGIAGFRWVTRHRDSSLRLGVGLSIPYFAYLQGQYFKSVFGFPLALIPTMVEFSYDASARQEISFRVGFHI